MNPVTTFFDALGPYLDGQASLQAIEDRLGDVPSPSGFDFYRRLMAANRRRILKHVFPTVAAVCAAPARAGIPSLPPWPDLCEAFARHHPARAWDPNEFGRAFPGWLATRDVTYPLSHLGDWSWRLLMAARAPRRTRAQGLDPSVSATAYPFDVPTWVASFERGDPVPPLTALARPSHGPAHIVVVFRDPRTLRARYHRPTTAELVAMARAEDQGPSDPGLDEQAIRAAQARLTSLGILSAEGGS